MFNATRVSSLAAAVLFGGALLINFATPAKADQMVDEAIVTFDHPVEVPGKVLPPGTYVFKSLDSSEIVQVFSGDQKQLFATVAVVPEDRPAQDVNVDCFVQLNKTRADAPQEVQGFFLSGRNIGYEFVYPAAHAAVHGQ